MAAFRIDTSKNEKLRGRACVCVICMDIPSQPTHILCAKYYISVSR